MDKKVYAISKKDDKAIASGFDHALRTSDNTFSVYFTDGSKVDLTIPLPANGAKGDQGASIQDAYFNADNKLVIKLDDGTELTPLTMPSAAIEVSKQTGNIVTQKADGIYAPATDLTNYVQKETGKGLSETNVTATMVANWNKAEQNVQPDWAQTDTTKDNYIQNKPTIPTVDSAISATSVNAVENKVVKEELDKKVNVAQGVANKDKFLKVGSDGNVTLGDVPSGTDIVTAWETTTSDTKVPSEKLVKSNLDTITQELSKKVAIAQGEANKGKALIVGNDGNVTCGTVATDNLTIVDKTQAQYDALTDAEKNDSTKLYNITDADDLDLTNFAKKSDIDAVTNYSTSETVVGTWIDGKPIYKKTYTLTNTTIQATTWTDLFDIPNNINKLIKTETIGNCSSTTKGYCVTSPYMCISNQTKISVYSPYLMGIEIVTLWYTKTTD